MFKNAVGVSDVLNEDCVFYANYLDINDFNGRRDLQLKIIDWHLSDNN